MRKKTQKKSSKPDVQSQVTEWVLGRLQAGDVLPWHRPWDAGTGLPLRHDGTPYRGVNTLMLMILGLPNPYWMTYNRAAILSGMQRDDRGKWIREKGKGVRAGEKSPSWVVFAKPLLVDDRDSDTPGTKKQIYFWNYSPVFNASQVDGLPERFYPKPREVSQAVLGERHAAAQDLIEAMEDEAPVEYHGDSAFYAPSRDLIRCPAAERFDSHEDFFSTMYHEGVHRTGHKSRLDRKHDYSEKTGRAREELVAELGAAMICCEIGLTDTPREDHASYIHSWIQLLQDDKNAIFKASREASAAVEYMLAQAADYRGRKAA